MIHNSQVFITYAVNDAPQCWCCIGSSALMCTKTKSADPCLLPGDGNSGPLHPLPFGGTDRLYVGLRPFGDRSGCWVAHAGHIWHDRRFDYEGQDSNVLIRIRNSVPLQELQHATGSNQRNPKDWAFRRVEAMAALALGIIDLNVAMYEFIAQAAFWTGDN